MNPRRLEGVWINLQFANPADEGGGGSLQPVHSPWAVSEVSLPTEVLLVGCPGDVEKLLPALRYTQLGNFLFKAGAVP